MNLKGVGELVGLVLYYRSKIKNVLCETVDYSYNMYAKHSNRVSGCS